MCPGGGDGNLTSSARMAGCANTTQQHLLQPRSSAILCRPLQSILHRDIKTNNIFCSRGGILKLGDFGISKVGAGACGLQCTVGQGQDLCL